MHELVTRIKDPDLCYVFARNATKRGHPELALQALRRAVDLRTEAHDPMDDIERAGLKAIYAYEEALSHQKGKRTRATGTWQMVNREGVIAALAKRLQSRSGSDVSATLEELNLADYSFQAVRAAYPEAFEAAA